MFNNIDATQIRSWLELLSIFVTIGSVILGYKVLIYDARKKKSEAVKTDYESLNLDSQTRKTQAEALDIIINSSTELIGVYKQIVEKLETHTNELEKEKLECVKRIENLEVDLQSCRLEMHTSRTQCSNEIIGLKEKMQELEMGTRILVDQIKQLNIQPAWLPKQGDKGVDHA